MTVILGDLLSALWRASWQGALAFLCVWVLCRLLVKRLPADTQCWLWRLSYVKLLIGLLWSGVILLPLLSPTPTPRFVIPPPIVTYHAERAAEAKWSHAAANVSVAAADLPMPRAKSIFPWQALLAIAYLIGVMVCLGRLLLAAHRTNQIFGSTITSATDEENSCLAELAQRMRMPRMPLLAHSASVDSPVYIAGRILLPSDAHYGEADLRMILAHELAHARRRDLHWEWLGTLVQILFFFHPLVMLARREERLARESAADALALQATHAPASEYGKLLLSLVLGQSGKRRVLTGAVGVIEGGSLLRRRLLALRDTASRSVSRRIQWRIALTLAPLILLVCVPWKMIHAQAQTPKMPTGDKSFTGVVFNETGEPVPGMTVGLSSDWPQPLDMRGATRNGNSFMLRAGSVVRSRLKSITDAQGRFAFTHLPAGHYQYYIYLRKRETLLDPGQYVGVQAALQISKADSQKTIRVSVSKGSLVTGRVVDGDTGQPMSGIFVNAGVIPSSGFYAKKESWNLPYDGITDAQGHYQIRVPSGNIGVGIGRGYSDTFSQRIRYAAHEVRVEPGQTASVPDLPVFLHPLIVFVGPDGKPLANTMVRFSPAAKKKGTYNWGLTLGDYTDNSGAVVLGRSDFLNRFENGAFSIEKDGRSAAGTFQCSPHHPLTIIINGHTATYPSGVGTVQLTGRSSSSLVTGTVVSEDGTPIPNALIRLTVAYPKRHYGLMDQVFSTDTSGVFRASFKPNGEYHAYVRADGFNEVLVSDNPLAVVKGKSTSLGTIHLVRAEGFVSGRVVDKSGKPMHGVLAFVQGGKTFLSGAVTDLGGNFRIPNVVEGETLTLRLSLFGLAPDSGVPISFINEEMELPMIQASPTQRQIVWHPYHEVPWQHRGRPF